MAKTKPETSLADLVEQTRDMIQKTLEVARARQRALKQKPDADEKAATSALVDLLWNSHTDAAGINYRMGRRRG